MTSSQSLTSNSGRLRSSTLLLLNIVLLITILINILSIFALIDISQAFRRWMSPQMWNIVIAISVIAMIITVTVLVLSWTRFQRNIANILKYVTIKLSYLRWFNLIIMGILVALLGYFVFGPIGQHTRNLATFMFSFWIVVLLNSVLLKAWNLKQPLTIQLIWINSILIAALVTTFGYQLAAALSQITDYTFTRGWSETSRYYNASLFFSKSIYGQEFPLPVLHPSEYLILSPPHLLPISTQWIHRAWQYLLVITMPLITAIILSQRLAVKGFRRGLLMMWIFLYLGIGPVYYHLLLPISIVLVGFDTNKSRPTSSRLIKSFLAIAIASVWAGISRVNWLVVPGLLAATIYLLEVPLRSNFQKPDYDFSNSLHKQTINTLQVFRYLVEPVFWILSGTAIAGLSYVVYILKSGNPIDYFTTTFSSNLLWYRLLPNSTYPPGILFGITVISLPLILLILGELAKKINNKTRWHLYHPIRIFSLGLFLFIMLIGGIIVSTKIGGGSNLHNLDAYLVILIVITTTIYFNKAQPDFIAPERALSTFSDAHNQKLPARFEKFGLVSSIIVLSLLTIAGYAPPDLLPMDKEVKRSAEAVDKYLSSASEDGANVLFISNRHLLTSMYKNQLRLIPDYERVFLMEMAMAGNEEYLYRFYDDLENQRFDMIIVEPLYDQLKGSGSPFGEENDIWVERISKPILCFYEELRTLRLVHIQILIPKVDVSDTCSISY